MGETLFISDLHLDRERPRIIALFTRFLREEAAKADALYILGDLFEYWIGDDDPAEGLEEAIAGLHALSRSGVPVYLMHGNRDFLMGRDFEARSGARLIDDPSVIVLYGESVLLMHGDTLCTDDVEYQALRRQLRDPAWQAQMLQSALALRRQQAEMLREKSREATQGKAEAIMDVNAGAVLEALREHGVQRLIHGHTHRPGVHELDVEGTPASRIVLGDWYEQGSVLRCNEQGCHLSTLA